MTEGQAGPGAESGHMLERQPHSRDPESGFCLACLLRAELGHAQTALRACEAALAEERDRRFETMAMAAHLSSELEAARAKATKAEDALRKIRDLHTMAATGAAWSGRRICYTCDDIHDWPCETDRIAGEALAAIRAPRQPEPVNTTDTADGGSGNTARRFDSVDVAPVEQPGSTPGVSIPDSRIPNAPPSEEPR